MHPTLDRPTLSALQLNDLLEVSFAYQTFARSRLMFAFQPFCEYFGLRKIVAFFRHLSEIFLHLAQFLYLTYQELHFLAWTCRMKFFQLHLQLLI